MLAITEPQGATTTPMRKLEPQLSIRDHQSSSNNDLGQTAVFFDFENIVLGIKEKLEPARVVEHLGSRGDVLIRRAYADWGRYDRYQSKLLELGVEMVFLPSYGVGDKNRTDTAIAVDAMEILFRHPEIDTFVIVSGDSDFGVLARKLRGYGKRIIGISARRSASKVLVAVCHEFIFYETLVGEKLSGFNLADGEKLLKRVLPSVAEDHGVTFQPSIIKDRMRKLDSTFSERNFGFVSFLKFLEKYPQLVTVQRYPGGRTEATVIEPGREDEEVPTYTAPPQQRPRAPAKPAREPRPTTKPKPAPAPKATTAVAASVVGILVNCLEPFGDESVALSKLKSLMIEALPDFDQKALGFKSFADFLRSQADQVTLIRRGRSYRVRLANPVS